MSGRGMRGRRRSFDGAQDNWSGGAAIAFSGPTMSRHEAPTEIGSATRVQGRLAWAWMLAAAVVAVAVHLPAWSNAFVFDDRFVVLDRAKAWQDESLWEIVQHDYWGDPRRDLLYRPVTTLSHVWNYRLSGACPAAFRAVNLVLHAGCCCLVVGLARALLRDVRLAGLAGLLFGVHALHVEAVVQVVGRAELLAAVFSLAALWAYVADARDGLVRPGWRYALAVVLGLLAAFSKENGTLVFPLAGLADLWLLRFGGLSVGSDEGASIASGRRPPLGRLLSRLAQQRWVGLVVAMLVVLMIRLQVLGRLAQPEDVIDRMDNPVAEASGVERALTPVVLFGKYVRLLLWPSPLSHDYSYNAIPLCSSPSDPRFLWGAACLVGAVVWGGVSWLNRGRALAGLVFFVAGCALVCQVVALTGTVFAERLMYLPSAGFCWLVGLVVVSAVGWQERLGVSPVRRWIVPGVTMAALVAANGVLSVQRSGVWRDEPSLIASAMDVVPDSARIFMQAGHHAIVAEDMPAAEAHFERVIEIMPDHMPGHFQLGRVYLETGKPRQALDHLMRAWGHLPAESYYIHALCIARAHRALDNPAETKAWIKRAKQIKRRQAEAPEG